MGQLAIPLVMAAASAATSAVNTRRTERRQDRLMADGIREQARKQRQVDARINSELDGLTKSSAARDRADALSEYVAQIAGNRGNIAALGNQAGRVSDAYADAASDAALGVADETEARAGLMAIQDGSGRQRQGEGRAQTRLGGDIGLLSGEAGGLDRLNRMRVAGVRRNPWLDFASAALGALAGAGAGGAAAGAGSGAAA
ncbi:hypothetical protein, partial [Ralstonia sp.]